MNKIPMASLFTTMMLLVPGILAEQYSIDLVVENSLSKTPPKDYRTDIASRGILIGTMRTLQETNSMFNFTYINNTDYGPFLVSVNGVAGNNTDNTYWELLVKNGSVPADVGIGCYVPAPNETIILNFTTYTSSSRSGTSATFNLVVVNNLSGVPIKTYLAGIVTGGILAGAMTRLQEEDNEFNFTYTEDPNYGPFLVSVNGVAGNNADNTYWELLVPNGTQTVPADVGIGCYIPKPNDAIILKFTKFTSRSQSGSNSGFWIEVFLVLVCLVIVF